MTVNYTHLAQDGDQLLATANKHGNKYSGSIKFEEIDHVSNC
jgi:hypothetical protein